MTILRCDVHEEMGLNNKTENSEDRNYNSPFRLNYHKLSPLSYHKLHFENQ